MVLFTEELKKVLKRKDARLLLLLSLWPLLFSFIVRISPGVLNYKETLSALGFLNQQIFVHSGILVPLILMIYMASISFYQEISEKQIYLYKDIPRTKILNGKYFSIYTVYFLFLASFIIISLLSYFLVFQGADIASGTFVLSKEEWIPILFDTFQLILVFVFYIHIGLSLSLRMPPGAAVFGTLFLYIFIKTTPDISWAKYLTPAGFRQIIDFGGNNLLLTLLVSLLVWLLYNIPMYLLNKNYINKIDFN